MERTADRLFVAAVIIGAISVLLFSVVVAVIGFVVALLALVLENVAHEDGPHVG